MFAFTTTVPLAQIGLASKPASNKTASNKTEGNSDAVPQQVVNLDMCTLSYQLYHQSLCIPLDPWYDIMSRVGSDRRENIYRFTHGYTNILGRQRPDNNSKRGYYSGPNSARGWTNSNLRLDPILTNYKQINPTMPAITRDGATFIAINAPRYITQNIRVVEGVRYRSQPTSFPSNDVEKFSIQNTGRGTDHLLVFEGGTGVVDSSEPSWSPMGFVLMRRTSKGYDAHIVFRGSRSGAGLVKTVAKAQGVIGAPKGNSDWITDLQSNQQIVQRMISKSGTVTKGFAESLPTMLGPIKACCKYFQDNYPAPDHIYVTGHSLGAALATQFVSATLMGDFGIQMQRDVNKWPWSKMTLMAYAQPISGNPTWAAEFNRLSPSSEHYWVTGDAVVEASSKRAVRLFIDDGDHGGVQYKLGSVANCSDNPHEVFVIRAALLRDLTQKHPVLSQQQIGGVNSWGYYDTFSNMLSGQSKSYVYPGSLSPQIITEQNLRRILQRYNFGAEFSNWLEQVYAKMIIEKSSYIGFKLQRTLNKRHERVNQVVRRMRTPSTNNNALDISNLMDGFKVIDDNLGLTDEEQWIFLGMVLNRYENSAIPLGEFRRQPAIEKVFNSKLNKE